MMMAVALGSREQFVERYIDHDAGNGCEAVGIDFGRPEREQKSHADESADRFGEA